jgi:hypothetical protein
MRRPSGEATLCLDYAAEDKDLVSSFNEYKYKPIMAAFVKRHLKVIH